MRAKRFSAIVAAALVGAGMLGIGTPRARAAQAVDVALVLAADVSRSITSDEFQLQRRGYASAIASPDVVKAIQAGVHGAIAATFVEWAGEDEQRVVVDWQIIHDQASAQKFVDTLLAAPRAFIGRTSISAALDFAVARLKQDDFKAEREIIDVSGDGTNNAGRPLADARAAAIAAGITINGLAIINESGARYGRFLGHVQPPGGLSKWYRDHVIGGPGAFSIVATDFESFGDAMTRKLVNEIVGTSPRSRWALKSGSRILP